MLNFFCKTVLHGTYTVRAASTAHKLHNPEKHLLSLLSVRYISSTSNQNSFTVSYLINSCGLSPETALSASKHVSFETPDSADLVLSFFKDHDFSQTQISNIIGRIPSVLLSDPEKTLLPKLDFFHSKGFTSPDIATVLSRNPLLLKQSLKDHTVPSFVFLQNLLGSNENTITAIKRFSGILCNDIDTNVVPNINILRENGVPELNIVKLLKDQPRVFVTDPVRFQETVEEVKEMGFNPLMMKFVEAIYAMRTMSKSTWEKKVNAYMRWGLSEAEILVAFRKHPLYMLASEDKIEKAMDFFVNTMGCKSSLIVERPILVLLSLEKRIVPRTLVLKFLLSKGLVRKDINLPALLESQEKLFLQKFVTPYGDASEILKLYKEQMDS